MGTRGFRVYRYRGRYFVQYNSCDSFPSGYLSLCRFKFYLSLAFSTVPKQWELVDSGFIDTAAATLSNIAAVTVFLQLWDGEWPRKSLRTQRVMMKSGIRKTLDRELSKGGLRIHKWPPINDLFFEWIYELDLDHENMPRGSEMLIKSIGKDSYGHAGYSPSTPEEHRFASWGVSAPNITQAMLDRYESYNVRRNNSTIEEYSAITRSRRNPN
ncbi:hypothetical protein C0995_005476 [Termitomyces sp. Mi166|nr:hypothetical protein C0995_005476 [Termitomyces sp. Mi166\